MADPPSPIPISYKFSDPSFRMQHNQARNLIERIKNNWLKAQNVINKFNTSNNPSKSSFSNLNKENLIEALTEVTCHLSTCFRDIFDLESTLNDYETINRYHVEVTDTIIKKVAEETKEELSKLIPDPKLTEKPKKQIITNKEQVLVIDGINKKDIEQGKTFSAALKGNLSNDLKGIPVSKSTISKEGKAILFFPTTESCNNAKDKLQNNYNVKNSDKKQTIILPRLKISNLDTTLTQCTKDELRNKLLSKNDTLKNATENEFQITFIDKNQNFAIAKVSPDIHCKLTNAGRVFIDLWSNKVSDHFHPIQCFSCQSFNHISSSPLCPAKDKPQDSTCLYCSQNHKSSQCQVKKIKKLINAPTA